MGQIKEFIEYIFNAIKIWIIVQPWQAGIRVRAGKKTKKLNAGMHFRIPYIDSVYVQEVRLRVVDMPVQTVTTKDERTITLNGAVGYIITDIEKLYKTLYHPETTIRNLVMSSTSESCFNSSLSEIKVESLEESILKKLNDTDYGIKFTYFKIINFAVVKTFRLIQDQSWNYEGLQLDEKK